VVIKVFFLVLVLCTIAVVAVTLAVHFRVKRHLREEPRPPASPASELIGVEQHNDAQARPVIAGAAQDDAQENRSQWSS